jgi:hypothetical protein
MMRIKMPPTTASEISWLEIPGTAEEMVVNPGRPAMLLVQADGRHSFEKHDDGDEGDSGDPFPGSANKTEVGYMGDTSTSFPYARSGVTLNHLIVDAQAAA